VSLDHGFEAEKIEPFGALTGREGGVQLAGQGDLGVVEVGALE
jgi:hypothetical protein